MTNQEAIEEINRRGEILGYCETEELAEALYVAIKALEQQKEGHNCNEDYADCDQFVCSECGIELQDWHRVEHDGDTSYHEYVFRFCPNCGAKMEGER